MSKKNGKRYDITPFPALTDIHTQEVTGLSPVVSVEKFLIYVKSGTFLLFVSKNILKLLAFSLTNTAIVSDRVGQRRAGNPCPTLP